MIVKLDATYHDRVMKYLQKEPEINLFIVSDIEKYGYDNYFLNIWADINRRGNIEGVLLKYFEFLIFYAYGKYDRDGFANLINSMDYLEISGKSESLEKLSSKLKLGRSRDVKFCKLDNGRLLKDVNPNFKIKRIKFGNISKVVKLYEIIEEFEDATVESIKNGLRTGRGYCIEINRQVVAMAKSTSENKNHAMIVGVGTHPNYRNKGLATKCIIKICSELLNENKIPCLFYDNDEAGKIYKKLGFKEVGNWSIYYK